ncbi:WhiB family transcriptional regulator [Streptomyces rubiginosohelvolus]|uniref:WhiB family transcriptional regulator n=1 Tax=Streptomyces rubiginosohelvolus TaxID=67362 RepID=UPI00363D32C7
MTTLTAETVTDWRNSAACKTADPDLFFPEPGTSPARIAEAKAYCATCPVKQMCLDEAFRTNERDAISGGLTPEEREQLLTPTMPLDPFQARRLDNASARTIAVKQGSDVLVWLVKRRMTVNEVADRLGVTPRAVFRAWLMLVPVPFGQKRSTEASAVEKLLTQSKESMRTLVRMGRSHDEIATVLGTSQSIVSASLSVLRQREDALRRLSRKGPQDALVRLQAEETRVRREARSGLTVQDVIDMHGIQIRRMHSGGATLRSIAQELGLCRETVRKAYREMTPGRTVRAGGELTRDDMRSAA